MLFFFNLKISLFIQLIIIYNCIKDMSYEMKIYLQTKNIKISNKYFIDWIINLQRKFLLISKKLIMKIIDYIIFVILYWMYYSFFFFKFIKVTWVLCIMTYDIAFIWLYKSVSENGTFISKIFLWQSMFLHFFTIRNNCTRPTQPKSHHWE